MVGKTVTYQQKWSSRFGDEWYQASSLDMRETPDRMVGLVGGKLVRVVVERSGQMIDYEY